MLFLSTEVRYMKTLLFILIFTLSLSAEENVKKVVFDLTSGNIKVFEKKVLSGISFHKTYYEMKLEELEVAVIVHGDAYKFFIKDLSKSRYKNDQKLQEKHKNFTKRIEILSETYEVEFLICKSGVKKLKIDITNLHKSVELVATSTVGLIEKQHNNYKYVPIF